MKQGKDYIIFPLDVASVSSASRYVQQLSGFVGMFKVGLELFIHSGREVIELIQFAGQTPIFLDLKLHDIPATVARAMQRIATLGIKYTTVHCGETPRMLEAAVEAAKGRVKILGVTVLTSVSAADIQSAGFKPEFSSDIKALVLKRAAMAKAAGCAGIVCSGLEVGFIKSELGQDFIAVTPAIRPQWEADTLKNQADNQADDQQRPTTPAQAVLAGADYLVIGRPMRDAQDPQAAAVRIAAEVDGVL